MGTVYLPFFIFLPQYFDLKLISIYTLSPLPNLLPFASLLASGVLCVCDEWSGLMLLCLPGGVDAEWDGV